MKIIQIRCFIKFEKHYFQVEKYIIYINILCKRFLNSKIIIIFF